MTQVENECCESLRQSSMMKCVGKAEYKKTSVLLVELRFSAFGLRSKCSICSRRFDSRRRSHGIGHCRSHFWTWTRSNRVYSVLCQGSSRHCNAVEYGPLLFPPGNGNYHTLIKNEKRFFSRTRSLHYRLDINGGI
jgi:hypothetical protein